MVDYDEKLMIMKISYEIAVNCFVEYVTKFRRQFLNLIKHQFDWCCTLRPYCQLGICFGSSIFKWNFINWIAMRMDWIHAKVTEMLVRTIRTRSLTCWRIDPIALVYVYIKHKLRVHRCDTAMKLVSFECGSLTK